MENIRNRIDELKKEDTDLAQKSEQLIQTLNNNNALRIKIAGAVEELEKLLAEPE